MSVEVVDAQGIKIEIMNDETTPVLVEVLGIQSISGIGSGTRSERDRTTLQSTDKEFGFGLKDNGSFTLSGLYSPSDAGQTELLDMHEAAQAAAREMQLTFENGEVRSMNVFVTSAPVEPGADADMTVSFEMRITGAITRTPAV